MPRQLLLTALVSLSLLSTAADAKPPAAKPHAARLRPAVAPPARGPAPAHMTDRQVPPPHSHRQGDGGYHHYYLYVPCGVAWDGPVRVYTLRSELPTSEYASRPADAAAREPGIRQTNAEAGEIAWPTALRGDAFRDARHAMEQLAAERPTSREAQQLRNREIRKLSYAIRTQLKQSVHELTATEYSIARTFLATLEAKLQST